MKNGVQQNFPGPDAPAFREFTDEQLAAQLKKAAGKRPVHQPIGELLGRHWEAAYAYARLLTDGPHPAGMLSTAAFTRLFEDSARQGGPTAAWRPQLLVTIRRLAGEWDADHRHTLLNPSLRSAPGARLAVRLLPPENRRLVTRAFQRLSEPARCLLWHGEVEREDVTTPAALLGIDPDDAAMRWARSRDMLREICLDVHREFAPDQECRRYARLLDVSLRRDGGLIDLDLRRHMDGCLHCHHAAEQLEGYDHRLPLLLAEGVLGWGAQAYLDARGTAVPPTEAAAPVPAPVPVGGEPLVDAADVRPAPPAAPAARAPEAAPGPRAGVGPARTPGAQARFTRAASAVLGARCSAAHRAPGRTPQPWQLALAVAAVGALVVVPLVAWSGDSSGGQPTAAPAGPSGSPGPTRTSGSGPAPRVGTMADVPTGAFEGRLRNEDSGLCVGLLRGRPVAGAEAALVPCGSAATQRWSYTADGRLRSAAAPRLCLDSHLGYSVQLAACAGRSESDGKNVRYDFTRQGGLVPRWNETLGLTPASSDQGAALVLKPRTEDATQRWLAQAFGAQPMESVDWAGSTVPASPSGTPSPAPSRTAERHTPTRAWTPKAAPATSGPPARSTPVGHDRGDRPGHGGHGGRVGSGGQDGHGGEPDTGGDRAEHRGWGGAR
ncbi:RICIN domain-containing protein [Streptomyces sp. NPDC048664]|uniref:RICIN domain-containing protein n=1 Tax=Streptomyces sp. NPDC048664 TaxID=3154505 RepID=UPI00344346A1